MLKDDNWIARRKRAECCQTDRTGNAEPKVQSSKPSEYFRISNNESPEVKTNAPCSDGQHESGDVKNRQFSVFLTSSMTAVGSSTLPSKKTGNAKKSKRRIKSPQMKEPSTSSRCCCNASQTPTSRTLAVEQKSKLPPRQNQEISASIEAICKKTR